MPVPRYEIRWTNSHYIILDMLTFRVERFAGTRKEIEAIWRGGK